MHPRRRTLVAKGIELFRALQLERILGKSAILEQYLNRAPFGANLIGIEAASRRYLGKEPGDLSLAEAALLAGMPQSPTRFRPDRFPERARKRQGYVLDRMQALGMFTVEQRAFATAQPIVVRKDAYPFEAPHFCDLVLDEWNETAQDEGGGMLQTTLDPKLQRLAEETLRRHAATLALEQVFGGAVVILEVKTGAVRALVGSPDYHDKAHAGQVNGATAPRSAGSTLKPFAYALALDQGRITPGLMLADVPRVFKDFTPMNFDGRFSGLVPARAALMMSLNIPALTLVEQEGVADFLHLLRRLGFGTLKKPASTYGLGLALGNGSVRLLDLANAYACIARGGEWRPYRSSEPEDGLRKTPGARIFSTEASWLIAEMLSGDERAETTTGHRADVRLPRVAWKTGTSSGFHDAWVVAFNPDYVVAVWLGNPDGHPSPALVGATAAVPVMWDVVRGLYPANDAPWFARPAGIKSRLVCAVSGAPVGAHCQATSEDWAIEGVSSAKPCQGHPLREAKDATSNESRLRLVSPIDGTVLKKVKGLAIEQRLYLKAEGGGDEILYWFVDNQLVAQGPGSTPASWPVERGRHVVVCCSASGHSARAGIVVE
jgi:penicillin-binding protein 1C